MALSSPLDQPTFQTSEDEKVNVVEHIPSKLYLTIFKEPPSRLEICMQCILCNRAVIVDYI